MGSDPQKYVVKADAICGRGLKLLRGDIATVNELGEYVDALFRAGAISIVPVESDKPPSNRASLL